MREPPPHDSLVEMFENSVERFGARPLFGTRPDDGPYRFSTYAEVGARVDHTRAGLAGLGAGSGDTVGIIANNREEWAVVAFAAYGRRARVVPMYLAEREEIWRYILQDAGIKVLFVAGEELAARLASWVEELPALERVLCLDGDGPDSLTALERAGGAAPVASERPDPEDIAQLIYTSGTTAAPKGVLLSHKNLSTNAWAGYRRFPELNEHGLSLSILPWAHSYGQTGDLNCFLQFGGALALVRSNTTIPDDMAAAQPTYLLAVPRILNRIHDGVRTQLDERGGLARALFLGGLEAARQRRAAREAGRTDPWASLRYHIAYAIAFRAVRQKLGGRLQGVLSGSATLNPEVCWFFHDIGVPVFDCYGLTETSPAVTMNSTLGFKPGSVGRPVDGVRVVIDTAASGGEGEDGEIVVYGPNVMRGYHGKPEATAAVMTADGGFRTGDRGRLDADGYLYVTGRIKEQFKLENGKYVFPAALEEDIRRAPGVANAVVFGAGRPYNVCLLVPDLPALERWAQERRLEGSGTDLLRRAPVLTALAADIERALREKYASYEIPRRWAWLPEDLTVEDGSLTQTLKLKRRVLQERYAAEVEALYA